MSLISHTNVNKNYWLFTICKYYRTIDPTILHGQGTHRSSLAWIGVDFKKLHY